MNKSKYTNIAKEEWLPLYNKGCSIYKLSLIYKCKEEKIRRHLLNNGATLRVKPHEENSHSVFLSRIKISETTNCWEWQSFLSNKGYGIFNIKGKQWAAHRYSFRHYKNPSLDKELVLHKCDNPKCVNPDHLFSGNHLDNSRDMAKKGRGAGQKLFTDNIPLVIEKINAGKTKTEIADFFNVDRKTISNFIKKWC